MRTLAAERRNLAKLALRALLRISGQRTQLLDCSRLRRSNFSVSTSPSNRRNDLQSSWRT